MHRSQGRTAPWVDTQERLAALYSTGTVRVARASGHDIPVDDPAGVVDAVLQVADP